MMRRYLVIFFTPVLLIVILMAFMSIISGPVSGDLTRIGRWAERDFGWNAPQPVIKTNYNGKSVINPDIVVLGDSFSRRNLWQSVLSAKQNKSTLSFHYLQVNCPSNWIQYSLNESPSAKVVIIETLERAFLDVFRDLHACRKKPPIPFESLPMETSATRADWPPMFSISYALRTTINTLKMNSNIGIPVRGSQVVNAPIKNNCANFSSRRNDRLLYLADNEDKLRWDRDELNRAISNVAKVQKMFAEHGKKFILIVIPDKLSVYQDCLLNDSHLEERKRVDVTNLLINSGVNTPDLLRPFKENIRKIVDLYLPDDGHLSESGYILLANELEKFITHSFPAD